MSTLNEVAEFIDTPPNPRPPPSRLKHHYGFSGCFLYRFFFFPLVQPLHTKGGRPGSGGIALLKCEVLSGGALVQTSVSPTRRGAEGNEGQVCVMVSTPHQKVTRHCWPAEV